MVTLKRLGILRLKKGPTTLSRSFGLAPEKLDHDPRSFSDLLADGLVQPRLRNILAVGLVGKRCKSIKGRSNLKKEHATLDGTTPVVRGYYLASVLALFSKTLRYFPEKPGTLGVLKSDVDRKDRYKKRGPQWSFKGLPKDHR
ncbi:hypothetical protein HZH68_011361 [Vespula germanica]|uniref:Uncharacterized protein n=2 Tax=Vespula TaxID=7451 RepID=A0A834N2H9_VESGE|nr:hypothetical protein HZH68_011361 [Vespula germanica]KAF7415932.1 hypothetical protein H0235_012524 [Vespula pensylvanica]